MIGAIRRWRERNRVECIRLFISTTFETWIAMRNGMYASGDSERAARAWLNLHGGNPIASNPSLVTLLKERGHAGLR